MVEIVIEKKQVRMYKSGFPILTKETITTTSHIKDEGTLLRLVDIDKKFIGTAYYGKENKGFGWVLSRNPKEIIDDEFFLKKFEQAHRLRTSFRNKPETTCYRVFNGIGDGIGGITIDFLAGYLLINWYNKGIYKFRTSILNMINQVFKPKGIYQKIRYKESKDDIIESYVMGEKILGALTIKENGIKYNVYLDDGPMIGIFLDQREVRKRLRDYYSKGKNILNLFAYTGAFSVSAALGGALTTTSVDLANRSRKKIEEQFAVNDLDMKNNNIIIEEVFNYFEYIKRKQLYFDVIILDPPSFSRSKKRTFSIVKNYGDLLDKAIGCTRKGGVIIASTNYAQINKQKFENIIKKAFDNTGNKYEIIERYSLPKDFHVSSGWVEGDYLKVFFLRKIS